MKTNDWISLAFWIVLSQAAGLIGSFFTAPAISEWYAFLLKPDLAPPNWVFAPVWTTLFLLMGIAAFLVAKHGFGRTGVRLALTLFVIQLALNTLWSILFFGLRSPGAALIEIIILWLAIAATLWAFATVSRPAAWLLVPYIAWVSFAAYLNYSIWLLNP